MGLKKLSFCLNQMLKVRNEGTIIKLINITLVYFLLTVNWHLPTKEVQRSPIRP